jgi:hypothetical protein
MSLKQRFPVQNYFVGEHLNGDAMSDQNLAELKTQARRIYRHWPVFLMLQIRNAEKHLDTEQPEEQRMAEGSDELQIIRQMNFPVKEEYDSFPLPQRETLSQSGARFWFRAGVLPDDDSVAVLDLIRFRANGDYHRRELLRVTESDGWFAERATQEFNRALDGYGVDAVFNAARLWASFSNGVTLPWEAVDADFVNEPQKTKSKKKLFSKTGKKKS